MKPKIIYSALLIITTFLVIPKASKANHIPNNPVILEFAINLRDRPDFFEEGRKQFEEQIQILEKERPGPVLTIENANLKEGGFTIWMPQGTITEETEVVETTFGNLEFKIFATHPPDARFTIPY